MKLKIIIFIISALLFSDANAHSPNSDSLIVYIDNIFIGKRSCVDFDKIPSVLLDNYYNNLTKSNRTRTSVKDPFSLINPKVIKCLFIEKSDIQSTNSILHIRTQKAKSGYLFVNECIMNKFANNKMMTRQIQIQINHQQIKTKADVIKFIKLRKKKIQNLEIESDGELGDFLINVCLRKTKRF